MAERFGPRLSSTRRNSPFGFFRRLTVNVLRPSARVVYPKPTEIPAAI
jgi:hypothetical protein